MDGDAVPGMNFSPQLLYKLRKGRSRGRRLSVWDWEGSEIDSSCFTQLRFR